MVAGLGSFLVGCASDPPGKVNEEPLTSLCGGTITPTVTGTGRTSDRYYSADVVREGVNYTIMANGWGPKFQSQTISWNGTAFKVDAMQGTMGDNYEPASYPTVFCGQYSNSSSGECGLPAAVSSINTLKSGWITKTNDTAGQYNIAYDIWVGTGPSMASFNGFLMVWLRDPAGQQPIGSKVKIGLTIPNVPGIWDLWAGYNGTRPCISYVRQEDKPSTQIDFDVMDFWRDMQGRGYLEDATHILSVAVGFEIWNGPITNLETTDFCVKVN